MVAFNNEKYIRLQSEKIKERINQFGQKLYLEFGGKIFDDYHATRVLPGFLKESKTIMLKEMINDIEIIVAISSKDIQYSKMRNDSGEGYENEVIKLVNSFHNNGFSTVQVVITQYEQEPLSTSFRIKLENMGIKVYFHYPIKGYPYDVEYIVSEEGFGKNEYVITEKPLVVVTAPGPGSGKMATCLSQLYHENKRGILAGYAKYETFPVWNLPLKHPINLAYEAATTDLNDVNMYDPFHLEAYNELTINYNRDIDVFPILREVFKKIYGKSPYNSPTDMGVNMLGFCIEDEEKVKKACEQEVIRRYLDAVFYQKNGKFSEEVKEKNAFIMKQMELSVENRPCVKAAIEKSQKYGGIPCVSIMLENGVIITGKQTEVLSATSSCLLNTIKYLAGIKDKLNLISPNIINPVRNMKTEYLGQKTGRLNASEILMALAINKATSSIIEDAITKLKDLSKAEAHSTVVLSYDDEKTLKRLNIRITKEPVYYQK